MEELQEGDVTAVWTLWREYSDCTDLRDTVRAYASADCDHRLQLASAFQGVTLPRLEDTWAMSLLHEQDRELIQQRAEHIEAFLQGVLQLEQVKRSKHVRAFLRLKEKADEPLSEEIEQLQSYQQAKDRLLDQLELYEGCL